MIFVEAPLFTKLLASYLEDDEYQDLQRYLMKNPESGDLIQGTGGLRKLRWKTAIKVNEVACGLFITGKCLKSKFIS